MRRGVSPYRIAFFGAVLAFFAAATANCGAKTYVTCTGLCENALPPCNGAPEAAMSESSTPYQECLDFCMAIQTKCESVGRPSVFLNYVACATDAGFTCTDAGNPDAGDAADGGERDADRDRRIVPIANAPCGQQQAELIQCEPADAGPEADTKLDIPDGAYSAGADCPDAGSCVACCAAAYPAGAKEYRAAVEACVCSASCTCIVNGHTRACQSECANEVCAPRDGGGFAPKMPEPGDPCDQCVTQALDEQTLDAGACVLPVNQQCNQHRKPLPDGASADWQCAAYANCVSQSGCTN
jgi:hypothetical protein